MAFTIRRIEYFYVTVKDEPGEAYALLAQLAELGVNLAAFTAIPFGPHRTQLTIFPDDSSKMQEAAKRASIPVDGPHPALLAQGDDELGALASVHAKLSTAGVNVAASTGVTDGKGTYGYVLYVHPEDVDQAMETLKI